MTKNKLLNLSIFSKIKTMVLFFVIIFAISTPYNHSNAASLNDLQKQKTDINKDITSKTQQSQQAKQAIDLYNKEITQLDSDINEIQNKINDTGDKIKQTQNDINDKTDQIKQKEQELSTEEANQDEAIRTMYESGTKNTFEIIVSSNTLSDLIDHSQYIESLENSIEATIDRINQIKSDLEKQKSDLENKKNDLSKLQDQQHAYKDGLDSERAQKNSLMADAKNQQKALSQQLSDAQKLSGQVDAQINSILSANNSSGRTVIARDRGISAVGFQWPMDYKYISAYFGDSTPFQSFHSGIDLVNVAGTPIYAASKGTVIAASDMMTNGQYYGYGKYIMIGHNAKYTSLYGHMMAFAVSVGDEVKVGDVIGYEGSTGWSTGPHMHFEIRENGSIVNPLNYLP